MDNTKYLRIFGAFEKAPLDDFLKGIFKGITAEQRKSLVIEDLSYHRLNSDVVTLEAWMSLAPMESNQWICVIVEKDDATGSLLEQFYTKDTFRHHSLESLQECIEYYKGKG